MSHPVKSSVSRHCEFYKAQNGKWYLELADREHGRQEDATTYGPFPTEAKAEDFLDNFSNPGSSWTDGSGKRPVPQRSPDGSPVVKPTSFRWGAVQHVAVRYLQRQGASESQKDLDWGVKKLLKALDDIEEVLIHWAPTGNRPGLADDHAGVAEAVSVMRQVGKILGPQIAKLKRMKLAKRGRPLDRKLRNTIARVFHLEGLNGKKYFRKAQDGYSKAVEVLQDYGIELDGTAHSHLFNQPEGRVTVDLAWTNQEDIFSPEPIPNTMLVITFYQLPSGKFEVISYLS